MDIDGIYGPETANAVRTFQRQFNLTQDGIVGKATWDKLYKIYLELVVQLPGSTTSCPSYPGTPLRQGDFGRDVSTLQAWLSYIADYDPGIPKVASDGIFGAGTRNAVVAFQRNYGLTADGIVGQATMEPAVRSFNADRHWNRLGSISWHTAAGWLQRRQCAEDAAVSQLHCQYLYQYPSRSNRRNFWKCHSQRGGSFPTGSLA